MAVFVLVPGAWLGAWAWGRVTPILQAYGHEVHPVTLPGLAERSDELSPRVGLMAHVDDIISMYRAHEWRETILVGHSYAGGVVGAVSRRIPEEIKCQVYLDTLPVEEGKAQMGDAPPDRKAKFRASLKTVNGTRVWPMTRTPKGAGARRRHVGL